MGGPWAMALRICSLAWPGDWTFVITGLPCAPAAGETLSSARSCSTPGIVRALPSGLYDIPPAEEPNEASEQGFPAKIGNVTNLSRKSGGGGRTGYSVESEKCP